MQVELSNFWPSDTCYWKFSFIYIFYFLLVSELVFFIDFIDGYKTQDTSDSDKIIYGHRNHVLLYPMTI